jgi:hypothetical protein
LKIIFVNEFKILIYTTIGLISIKIREHKLYIITIRKGQLPNQTTFPCNMARALYRILK